MKLQALQCDSKKLRWKLFHPEKGLYLGRKNPNGPMRWVRRGYAVSMSKRSIRQRYPNTEIDWKGWLN